MATRDDIDRMKRELFNSDNVKFDPTFENIRKEWDIQDKTVRQLINNMGKIYRNRDEWLNDTYNILSLGIDELKRYRRPLNEQIKVSCNDEMDENHHITFDVKEFENVDKDLSNSMISNIDNVSTSIIEINDNSNDIDNISLSEVGTIKDDSMDMDFSEEVKMISIENYISFSNDNEYDYDSCESECDYSEEYDDNITDLDDFESFDIINESEDSFSFDSKFSKYVSFFEGGYVTVIEDRTVAQKRIPEHFTDTRHVRRVNEILRYIFREEEGSSRMLWDPGKVSKEVVNPRP